MTTANIITIIRILLIPVFMVLTSIDNSVCEVAAIVIFIVASATDGLDGYIARKYKQVTNFGKFIDPLADKLLVMSAMLMFIEDGIVPAWCVVIILAREFTVTSLRMVAASDGIVIQAAMWGKIKTFTQIVGIVILMIWPDPIMLGNMFTLQEICIYIMTLVAVISGVSYVKNNYSVIKDGFFQKGE